MDVIDRVRETKALIFTITPGRSGTKYLATLFNSLSNVSAHHEPTPDFVSVMRRVQQDPEVAFSFLRHEKLPVIAAAQAPVYAETSHVFSKGFLEPMLLMELRPKLVVLRRYPTDVAWSLVERNMIPGRTGSGSLYLLDPRAELIIALVRGIFQHSDRLIHGVLNDRLWRLRCASSVRQ